MLTTDDGALGSVLGEESSGNTTGREHNDGSGVLLDSSSDGREGERLGSLGRSRGELSELVKQRLVGDGVFGSESGLGHHFD